MGRIKLQLVKRTTKKLIKEHRQDFKQDFVENKKMLERYAYISNKKIRNTLAGYLTKMVKKKEED